MQATWSLAFGGRRMSHFFEGGWRGVDNKLQKTLCSGLLKGAYLPKAGVDLAVGEA